MQGIVKLRDESLAIVVEEVFVRRFHRRFCVGLKSWLKDIIKTVSKSFEGFRL